ncbi:MAG: sugar phosphate nucleotidyltransferase, partial [bacterium]
MIRKALIPIAGKAIRLMPVTSVVPKAMFPLVDRHGCIRSVLHIILKEATSAGIEHVGVVISPWQWEMLQQYFDAVSEGGSGELLAHTEYITQSSPKGFGDAVLKGADFVGDEPFMLMLGDHVYVEDRNKPRCVGQIAKAFNSIGGVAMIGVQPVSADELHKVGVVAGIPIQQDIYLCTDFVEKPDLLTARQRLVTAGL